MDPKDPEALLRAGDLDGALKSVKERVRDRPDHHGHRLFLFQLLAVQGDLDRALTHLNVAADLNDEAENMAKMYRAGLACEVFRREVFSGARSPLIFGEPEEWLGLLVQAVAHLADGQAGAALSARDQAFEAAPTISGHLNDEPFEWIMDADSRLGPVLEMVVNGKYYWVPFHRVREMKIDEPKFLKDRVWLTADVVWANRGRASALIPVRYAGSEQQGDPALALAGSTTWEQPAEGYYVGAGQRTLSTDSVDVPILDVRSLVLDVPEVELSPEDIEALSKEVLGDTLSALGHETTDG